jgi:tryptophan synthase alpha chain
MTYVNPVLSYGLERFTADAAAAGADALIVPDVPLEEAGQMRAAADATGLALILLVAPTTPDARLAAVCAHASGFVYCVSVTGITGARSEIAEEAMDLLRRVRRVTDLPRALGFGLSTHAHMQALRGHAEGAVVGSALLNAVAAQPDDAAGAAERFLSGMLGAKS